MVALLVLVVVWVIVMPLLALVRAFQARERALKVEGRLAALERTRTGSTPVAPAPSEARPVEVEAPAPAWGCPPAPRSATCA